MGNKNWWAMMVVTVMAAAACTSTPSGSPAPVLTPGPPHGAGYTELDQALDGTTFKGKTVSIQTQWIGGEGANFAAAIADFAKTSGITIQVDSVGSSHESTLRLRIQGGQPPDLAVLAQPPAVLAYGKDGKLADMATIMDTTRLKNEHPATIGLVTEGDHIWGIPFKADVKSTVWYPIKPFEAAGYTVPTTWDELVALSNKIVADGKGNPWCMGMEAGTATGWQFTDWVEEVMLRTQTPEKYNQWINHELKFNSPEVKAAFEKVAEIMFTPNFVFGGNTAIVQTKQTVPFDGAFPTDGSDTWDGFTPKCWMHKIPTWYGPDFFPDVRANLPNNPDYKTIYEVGTDVGMFYLPPINPAQGAAALGSADTLIVMKDRPEVRAVAQFLSTPEGLEAWIATGSAISANNTTPQEWYSGFYKLDIASKIVNSASYVGFDASDLMPPEVGAGTFWTEAVKYINANGTNLDAVLTAIDATTIAPDHKFGSW